MPGRRSAGVVEKVIDQIPVETSKAVGDLGSQRLRRWAADDGGDGRCLLAWLLRCFCLSNGFLSGPRDRYQLERGGKEKDAGVFVRGGAPAVPGGRAL